VYVVYIAKEKEITFHLSCYIFCECLSFEDIQTLKA